MHAIGTNAFAKLLCQMHLLACLGYTQHVFLTTVIQNTELQDWNSLKDYLLNPKKDIPHIKTTFLSSVVIPH